MKTADYLDIDYTTNNAAAQALIITAYWSRSPQGPWDAKIQQLAQDHRVEVGILDQRPALAAEKLSFGGVLTVLGESEELSPTFFSFYSRHVQKKGSYSASFNIPTGLHPKLLLKIAAGKTPADDCSLNAYFTLPKTFFVDKYQLADAQLLESLGLRRLRALYGEADLEAPTWTQSRWGSSVLLEIESQEGDNDEGVRDVELPLHLRYLEPTPGEEYVGQDMPWPVVFWACPSQESEKFTVNPFDRKNIGYEHMFDNNTVYHHLSPETPRGVTYSSLKVPVLDLENASVVKIATVLMVASGFIYITTKILLATFKTGKSTKVE